MKGEPEKAIPPPRAVAPVDEASNALVSVVTFYSGALSNALRQNELLVQTVARYQAEVQSLKVRINDLIAADPNVSHPEGKET